MRSDQHLAEFDKIAVFLVVDFDDAPGVATAADFTAFGGLDFGVGTDNCKGDFGHDLVVLRDRFFVV